MKSPIPIVAAASLGLLTLVSSNCSDSEETVYHTPPVGVLKAADYQITLHSGADGPLYSVADPDGTQLAREIDENQLAAEFPKVHAEVTRLIADRKTWWAGNEAGAPQSIPVETSEIPPPAPFRK
jgi:hypothetical protein